MILGAKLITIVRSIPSLYESNFGYFFHRTKEFEKAETLENFYSDPKKYFDVFNYDSRSMFARNAMAHDLGRFLYSSLSQDAWNQDFGLAESSNQSI